MSCESCLVFAMTRGVAALIAVLIAGSTDGTWARDRNDHRALNASILSDVTSCSVATAKQVPGREGVTIRDARFEGASPIEDSPSVMLRFVVRNDTTARINGVIVSVSLFSVAGRMLDTSSASPKEFP